MSRDKTTGNTGKYIEAKERRSPCTSRFFLFFVLLSSICSNAQQTERVYLSGTGSDHTVNWDFFCTGGMNSGKWTTIAVPSCWELQGFGKYDYGFAKDSVRGKEKGLYKYSFVAPNAWKGKVVKIVFEGVMTDAEVKINGKSTGETHQGAFYAFKYNITDLLKFGESNLLEVTVAKHSSNESVNAAERRADFWLFGGIFRPVYLEALPVVHVENIRIDAKANGSFNVGIETSGSNRLVGVSVKILDPQGHIVATGNVESMNYGDERNPWNPFNSFWIQRTISNPKLWSPEFPVLYKAVITVSYRGKIMHMITQNFGFRTVEVKARDGIYINGVKVKMKGVNRHSFWPTSGRTLSRQRSIEDVLLMKDMNMNAVRMSHYPPDDHFLDVCDSLGLFVLDELAGWHGHYDTPTGTKLLEEMIDHDRNHPSVVIWDNGNEGGHNLDLDTLFKHNDIQARPVIHPWFLFGGIETMHYREYNYGIGNYDHGHDIVMPTEFLHGLYDGGHGAGLEDYWEAMWKNPLSAGGFLWSFADEGVVRRDKHDSIDTDGNHGPDGIVGPFHEKEGSYYTIKEVWSPVVFEKKEITPAFDGKLQIENRYFFTNTNKCKFSWKLKNVTGNKELSGKSISPSIAPGAKGILQINLPSGWQNFDVLYVTTTDFYNRELFTWSFPIISPAKTVLSKMIVNGTSDVKMNESDSLYNITAGEIELSIHRRTGLVTHIRNKQGEIPLTNGPIIQEGINNFKGFTYHYDGKLLIIQSSFDRKNNYNTLQWTIYPSGWIKMQLVYFPADYFTSMVGVNFSFPEKDIRSVQYMGYGPYRVWKNRMKGQRFDVWNKVYNNTETGETWNYPEFKGYYRNVYWCKFLTGTQPFSVYTETEDMYLRLFTPAWKTDQWHNYEPTFPSGDISFMQAIPGIGSKTQRPETTGPMGMKNIYYDYDKDPTRALKLVLYFDFAGKE